MILFNETLKVIENKCRDICGYDMSLDESNIYVEILGKMNINIIVLIDLKRKIKENDVFAMKAKTHTLIALPRRNFFFILYNTTRKMSVLFALTTNK